MSDLTPPSWLQNATTSPLPPEATAKTPGNLPDEDEPFDDDENFEAEFIDGTFFPRVASQHLRAMSKFERAAWDEARLRCKLDPIYLSEILQFDMQETPHRMLFRELGLPFQNPRVEFSKLDEVTKKRMVLWPRGLFKTSAIIVEIVQVVLNYPGIRILFLTGSDTLAKRQLKRVRSIFEKPTPEFLRLFPEMCLTSRQNKKSLVWTDVADSLGTAHEFTVPCRPTTVFAEPTFAISTADSVKSGSHFDMIVIDDLVNDQNYKNAKALETCYENYVNILPLLEPTGYILVTGTRYSFDDTYERIQTQAKNSSVWRFSVKSCWSSNCKNCGCADLYHDYHVNVVQPPCTKCRSACPGFQSDGTTGTLFPIAVTRTGREIGQSVAFLFSQKVELGDASFANQYENRPISTSEQIFSNEMIGAQTIWDPTKLPVYGSGVVFACGDLAYSESEKGDRDTSVIFTVVKFLGQLYVVDCAFGKWGSAQLVEATIKLLWEKRPTTVYFEKPQGPADALRDLITARARQVGLQKAPIEFIPAGNSKNGKAIRINNLQAALTSRVLWLFGGMPGYAQLCEQLQKWPRTKHDDFADALARVCEVSPGWALEAAPPPQNPDNWLARMHGAEPVVDEDTRPCGSY